MDQLLRAPSEGNTNNTKEKFTENYGAKYRYLNFIKWFGKNNLVECICKHRLSVPMKLWDPFSQSHAQMCFHSVAINWKWSIFHGELGCLSRNRPFLYWLGCKGCWLSVLPGFKWNNYEFSSRAENRPHWKSNEISSPQSFL